MEKKYGFRVKMKITDGSYVLNIKSSKMKVRGKAECPILFSEVNIPLVAGAVNSYKESGNINSLLDFKNISDCRGNSIGDCYRPGTRFYKVISSIIERVNISITGTLDTGRGLLKKLEFVEISLENNTCSERLGSPRSSKNRKQGKRNLGYLS